MFDYGQLKIGVRGKANEDYELLRESYAIGYDALNNYLISGTHEVRASRQELVSRFAHIKRLARKYAPQKIPIIDDIERVIIANFDGTMSDQAALSRLRGIAQRSGVNATVLMQVEDRVRTVETLQPAMTEVVRAKRGGSPLLGFFGDSKPTRGMLDRFAAAPTKDSRGSSSPILNFFNRGGSKAANPLRAFFEDEEKARKNPLVRFFDRRPTNEKREASLLEKLFKRR